MLIELIDQGNGVYQFNGTVDAINASLDNLIFEPTANRVEVGQTETTTFTIQVTDGYEVITDNTTSVITTSVNDAPILINPIPEQTIQLNTPLNINVSSYFQDLDVNDSITFSATDLPTGLTINANTGIITGQVDSSINTTATITVTDQHNVSAIATVNLVGNNFDFGTNATDRKYFNRDNNANNFYDGLAGNDYIYGYGGNDYLKGGSGSDRIYGGYDDDTIEGGLDNDYVYGDSGNDSVLGNEGNDYLYSGNGYDTLDGGAGNDTYYGNKDNKANVYVIGEGSDKIYNFDEKDAQGNIVDKLKLANGLTFTDLEIVDSGSNVYIKYAGQIIVTIYGLDHLLFTNQNYYLES